jgi:hypothetical protein
VHDRETALATTAIYKEAIMRIKVFLISVFLSLCSLPALALTNWSLNESRLEQMYTPPNQFYLNHENDAKMLSYSKAKTVRVCDKKDWVKAGRYGHAVGIDVTHDGSTSKMKPGTCATYTARNFTINPAAPLNSSDDLQGTIARKG